MRLLTSAMAQTLHDLRRRALPGHDNTARFEDCIHCTHNRTPDGMIVYKHAKRPDLEKER